MTCFVSIKIYGNSGFIQFSINYNSNKDINLSKNTHFYENAQNKHAKNSLQIAKNERSIIRGKGRNITCFHKPDHKRKANY